MKKNVKKVLWLVIGIIIGTSTIVGAATIFRSEDITYSSPTNKTNVKDSLDELYSKVGKCPAGKLCADALVKNIQLGDYINMTPTNENYIISAGITGYESNQEINPSELNIWRVIKKNEDGTVEVVSDEVSSNIIYFNGRLGYANLVGGLNKIAEQYTNSKYVQSTRHFGYNNQIGLITDESYLRSTTPPWNKQTSIDTQWTCCDENLYLCGVGEEMGAGDIGYETDYSLVNAIYGTLQAKTNGKALNYWIASRIYRYLGGPNFWEFRGRAILSSGELTWSSPLYTYNGNNSYNQGMGGNAVRPILTLKSNIKILSGDGKSVETAYTFE